MGGLGPGIGGLEYLLIAAVALIVIGPERLPGVLRKLGQVLGKARRMADEFRSSFDEMARQTELDDLRKEVEALRTNQGAVRLGDEADAAFKDIKTELYRPVDHDARAVMAPDPVVDEPAVLTDEWPDTQPVMMPIVPVAEPMTAATPKAVRKTVVKARAKPTTTAKPKTASPSAAMPTAVKDTQLKPRAPRKTSPSA